MMKTKIQQSISVQLFIPQANPPYGILEAQLRKVQGRAHHAGKEMTDRESFFHWTLLKFWQETLMIIGNNTMAYWWLSSGRCGARHIVQDGGKAMTTS